eukprot:GHVU01154255.1.p1 GENE.GHVU01154255.1~~GHVU01154255.1.p1  ORF type:complete len:313 (-),score=48.46 GHVU01154255.1:223-1161(-)
MFFDNLAGQTTDSFQAALGELNIKYHYFVGGTTDLCQPIDAGVGHFVQQAFVRSRDEWLRVEENSSVWFGGIPATTLRVMTTKWLGAALLELRQRPKLIQSAALRTGCAMKPGDPGAGVKLQGLETAIINYDDVGADFANNSDDEGEPGADAEDIPASEGEDFVHGSDYDAEASVVSSESADSDSDGDAQVQFVHPSILLPHGHVQLESPEPLQAAIGKRILVKVQSSRRKLSSKDAVAAMTDWWSGTVVTNTSAAKYKEARLNLGHNLVVRFDEVFERCADGMASFPFMSFALRTEDYGRSWILFAKPPAN